MQLQELLSPQHNPQACFARPQLIDLLNKHKINTIHLARAARLRTITVRSMALQRKPVQPVVAMQVLHGIEELTGKHYIITDIDMPVLPYE
jgi:hypothetical protein